MELFKIGCINVSTEVEVLKRKILRKKERKHANDQEKIVKNQDLDHAIDKKKASFKILLLYFIHYLYNE